MSAVEARRAWSWRYVSQAPEAPTFGSEAWLALPDGAAKIAACVRAAEAWARDGDDLQPRLRAELEAVRLADKRAEDAEWAEQKRAHRAAWDRRAGRLRPDPRIAAEVERDWREWVGEGA